LETGREAGESSKTLNKSQFWNKSIDVPDKIDENPNSSNDPTFDLKFPDRADRLPLPQRETID
jgi:hypothetical protein